MMSERGRRREDSSNDEYYGREGVKGNDILKEGLEYHV